MVPDPLPQPVTAPLTPAAIFLVVTIDEGGEAAVHDALPDISGLVRAVGFRDTDKHLSVVTSIGSDAWDRLFSGPRPAELTPFIELRRAAPQRPGDAGRSAVPHQGAVDGHVLRAGGPDRQGVGGGHRRRRDPRLPVLRQPRPAGLRRRHREPRRPTCGVRHRDWRRGPRFRGRLLRPRAEVRARHGLLGVAVGHRAGTGDRADASSRTSRWTTTSSRPTPTSRST